MESGTVLGFVVVVAWLKTAGDSFRHFNKRQTHVEIERWMIHSVLVFHLCEIAVILLSYLIILK
jgi:hypothetical protein